MNAPEAADFAAIARQLHAQSAVEDTLDSVVQLACETLAADMCGVMVVHGGSRVESAAVTNEVVAQADRAQLECGEGPCLEAMEEHAIFIIRDTRTEKRWEPWCRRVVDLGVRSVLSIRLFTQQGTIGSLNVYHFSPNGFDEDDASVGAIFASHASVALAAAHTESGLRQAVDGRHVIGMAQGILMERYELTQDQSFAVLRRYSQDRNIKLRGVAQHVVETRKLPAGEDAGNGSGAATVTTTSPAATGAAADRSASPVGADSGAARVPAAVRVGTDRADRNR